MNSAQGVKVLDGFLPEDLRTALIESVSWMPIHFLNRWDRFRSHELDMHWYYPVAFSDDPFNIDVEPNLRDLDDALKPISHCWELIKANHGSPVRLYECMISANTFGTEGRIHSDISGDEVEAKSRHHTALVYCNRTWDASWAGETLVFDQNSEIIAAVIPRPGRIMTIAGDPPHVGRSVSRICPSDRRVLVFKYWSV